MSIKSLFLASFTRGSLSQFEPKDAKAKPEPGGIVRYAQLINRYTSLVVGQLQKDIHAKIKVDVDYQHPYIGTELKALVQVVQAHFPDRKLWWLAHRVDNIIEVDFLLQPKDVPDNIGLQIEASHGKYGLGQIEYRDMVDWIGPSTFHNFVLRHLQGSDLLEIALQRGHYKLRDHARYTAEGVNPNHVVRTTNPTEIKESIQNLTGTHGIVFVPPPVIEALKNSDYAERGSTTEIGVMLKGWTHFRYQQEKYSGYMVLVELGCPEHVRLEQLQGQYATIRTLMAGDRRLVNGVWQVCIDPHSGQWGDV